MNRALELLIIALGAVICATLLGFTEYKESYVASFIVGGLWAWFAEWVLFPFIRSLDKKQPPEQ